MKVLLDTNIIIHREANRIVQQDIGQLFNWLDKLHYEKYVHPITILEIKNYQDKQVVETFSVKLDSYHLIKHQLPFSENVQNISNEIDVNDNDINDTHLLNEVYEGRIDILITQDKKIHLKAHKLGISKKVFKIQSFLEKPTSENPDLVNYDVLAVKHLILRKVILMIAFLIALEKTITNLMIGINQNLIKFVMYVIVITF